MKYWVIVLCLAFSFPSFGCDMCGCSATSQYLGVLNQTSNQLIGVSYQLRKFSSVHPDDGGKSSETYQTGQLWGKFRPSKNIYLFAFVPYHNNLQSGEDSRHAKGLGDITFLVNYRLLNSDSSMNNITQNLLLGGGVKLPTGHYKAEITDGAEGIPNMQPGSASYDYIVNLNYTIKYLVTGINVDASYTITTANKYDYRFGNRFAGSAMLFRMIQKNKVQFIPQAGITVNYFKKDLEVASKELENVHSGGWINYISGGFQLGFKKWSAFALCHLPFRQNFAEGNTTSNLRLDAGVVVPF